MQIIRNSDRIDPNTFLGKQIPMLNDFMSFWIEQFGRTARWRNSTLIKIYVTELSVHSKLEIVFQCVGFVPVMRRWIKSC